MEFQEVYATSATASRLRPALAAADVEGELAAEVEGRGEVGVRPRELGMQRTRGVPKL